MNDYDDYPCPFCRPFNWLKRLWARCWAWRRRREARRALAFDFGPFDETLAAMFRSEPYKTAMLERNIRADRLAREWFPKPERPKRQHWWCFINRKTAK